MAITEIDARWTQASICCTPLCVIFGAFEDMDDTTGQLPPSDLVTAVANIMVAFLAHRPIEPEELPGLLIEVRRALTCELSAAAAAPMVARAADNVVPLAQATVSDTNRAENATATLVESQSPPQTVFDEYLICLEDGKRYRSLRRHLMSKYGMSPEEYRAKWNLPKDYPMVAPSYARARSEVAKRTGLGRPAHAARSGARSGSKPSR